jgi:AraC-like DNA-binding protein
MLICVTKRRFTHTVKSLTRATLDVTGLTAKTFIASRITLEAKRLLVLTALPTTVIADRIGFDEASNFVKFFRREVGCSPGEFRRKCAQ